MTAKIHYGLITPSAFSSQLTATPGYTAANTGSTAIRKPWVSSVAANGSNDDWIEHDYGSNKTIAAIAVMSCLQASGSIKTGTGTPAATAYGTIDASTIGMPGHGVRRGSWIAAATARYIRADFTNALDARGDGVYATYGSALMELGAMYAFANTLSLPVEPLIDSGVQYLYPQSAEKMPNGQTVTIARGAPRARITLKFRASAAQDIERIARIARAGLCWLDLGISTDRSLQWPVRYIEDNHGREFTRPRREPVTLVFEELT